MTHENRFFEDVQHPFSLSQLKIILESVPANIFFKDLQGRYQIVSHLCDMLNTGGNGTIIGKTDLEVQPDPVLGKKFYEEDMEIARTGEAIQYLQEMVFDGVSYHYEISKLPVRDEDGSLIGIIGIVNDMTDYIRMQTELKHYSEHDTLTGVFNRSYYAKLLTEPSSFTLPMAVVMADCDDLKYINDTYGHGSGDELLVKTTTNLRDILQERGTIIRIGGDEFLILIPDCTEQECRALLDVIRREEAKLRVCQSKVSTTYGFSIMESAEDSLEEAVNRADRHMYEIKAKNKGS